VLPTQGTVPTADRATLADYARTQLRHKRLAEHQQSLPVPAAGE
jgi:hypothetical protein